MRNDTQEKEAYNCNVFFCVYVTRFSSVLFCIVYFGYYGGFSLRLHTRRTGKIYYILMRTKRFIEILIFLSMFWLLLLLFSFLFFFKQIIWKKKNTETYKTWKEFNFSHFSFDRILGNSMKRAQMLSGASANTRCPPNEDEENYANNRKEFPRNGH